MNDLAMAREALKRAVALVPGAELAWVANDGDEAVAKCRADTPDLVLMDLVMPRMGGVEATRQIMGQSACPVIVVTATVEGNAPGVYEAISAGALDAVDTPRMSSGGAAGGDAGKLLGKIAAVRAAIESEAFRAKAGPASAPPAASPVAVDSLLRRSAEPGSSTVVDSLLLIGASTGGPQAIVDFFAGWDRARAGIAVGAGSRSVASIIVQHMDPQFLPGFATWLAGRIGHRVSLARAGQEPVAGDVLVAEGGKHLAIGPSGAVVSLPGKPSDVHSPSINTMFESAARVRPGGGAAVLLTGMGRDGASGLLTLRRAGWQTFAQDRNTSVVWGMPGEAKSIGAVDRCHAIETIGAAVVHAMADSTVKRVP
ncbi:MAG: response regulator [Planctomycetota bacterium]|nr:response regulator [Planctomycetota bacterium]MDA1106513.1 response regulator [Planctomycetota bacterium]